MLNICLALAASLLAVALLLCVTQPLLLIFAVPLVFLYRCDYVASVWMCLAKASDSHS